MTEYLQRFSELSACPRCDDWAAKLQDVCEEFWQYLDTNLSDTDTKGAFISLLSEDKNLALAQMVIPELRGSPETAGGQELSLPKRSRQEIRDGLRLERAKHHDFVNMDQSRFDTRLYQEEKDVLAEVELHRAKMLVLGRVNLSADEHKEFEKWWDSCPVQTVVKGPGKK